jgi:hypothetical protein
MSFVGQPQLKPPFHLYDHDAERRSIMKRKLWDVVSMKASEVGFPFHIAPSPDGFSIHVGVDPVGHLAALQRIQQVCFPEWEPLYQARFENGLAWFTFTR